VLREFSGLHRQLTDFAGVDVALMQHAVSHGTPDACFPNNWISTHSAREGGGPGAAAERTLVLYPMKCPNRAAERRPDVIAAVQAAHGPYGRVVDLSGAERAAEPHYFEGTGGGGGGFGGLGVGVWGREQGWGGGGLCFWRGKGWVSPCLRRAGALGVGRAGGGPAGATAPET
jgi:hypothetical protein